MSSPKPSFSLGMSCGPSFLVPPGLLLLDRPLLSLRVSKLSLDDPFINAPMLGIVLAWDIAGSFVPGVLGYTSLGVGVPETSRLV